MKLNGQDKIKVLYIGGYSRSGSTLLDRTLGQMDGFFSVGELRYIWERSFKANQPCGCGKPFRDCPFWKEVFDRTHGGFDRVDLDKILWLKRNVDRMRYIPQLLSPRRSPAYRENLKRYSDSIGELYAGIHEVSGAGIIVDSSKDPSYALAMAELQNVDLYLVQLVRDSRAAAYSWFRKKAAHEIQGKKVYMARESAVNSSLGWMQANLLIEPLKLRIPSMTVRYEDFILNPAGILSEILALAGEKGRRIPLAGDNMVYLRVNHTVSGNPMRFQNGPVELRLDDEWRTSMRPADKRTVTALTWPLLLKYGYFGGKKQV